MSGLIELSGQSVPKTKPDEACRWLPRPTHALHTLRADNSPKPSHTHDNRHLSCLCEALDVSSAELYPVRPCIFVWFKHNIWDCFYVVVTDEHSIRLKACPG